MTAIVVICVTVRAIREERKKLAVLGWSEPTAIAGGLTTCEVRSDCYYGTRTGMNTRADNADGQAARLLQAVRGVAAFHHWIVHSPSKQ